MMRLLAWLMLLGLAAPAGRAAGGPAPTGGLAASQPDAASTPLQIKQLVDQLSDRSFDVRQNATQRLGQLDSYAPLIPWFRAVQAAAGGQGNLEALLRIRLIARAIHFRTHVKGGFIGISLTEVMELADNVPRTVIQVVDVIPASPAEKADLRLGDRIVKLNGRPLNDPTRGGFVRQVAELPPGQVVRLTVERQDRTIEKEVTLAHRETFGVRTFNPDLEREFEAAWVRDFDAKGELSASVVGAMIDGPIMLNGGQLILQDGRVIRGPDRREVVAPEPVNRPPDVIE